MVVLNAAALTAISYIQSTKTQSKHKADLKGLCQIMLALCSRVNKAAILGLRASSSLKLNVIIQTVIPDICL